MARKKKYGRRNAQKKSLSFVIYIIIALLLAAGSYFGFTEGLFDIGTQPKNEVGTVTEIGADNFQLHMIDVGQGDAYLLCIPDGTSVKTMIIDAGTSKDHKASIITDYISSLGIKTIDYMLLTHPHSDHIGAATSVLTKFDVKNAIIPDCNYTSSAWTKILEKIDEENSNVIFPEVGQKIKVGDATVLFLAPSEKLLNTTSGSDYINNYSIVCKVTYGENSFMFTGDACTQSEAEILATFSRNELKCDVLKLGHHGSSTSSSEEFLRAVDPDIVLISLAKDNSYGHPHKETVEKLNKLGPTVYRTDEEGTVIIVSDGSKVSRYSK